MVSHIFHGCFELWIYDILTSLLSCVSGKEKCNLNCGILISNDLIIEHGVTHMSHFNDHTIIHLKYHFLFRSSPQSSLCSPFLRRKFYYRAGWSGYVTKNIRCRYFCNPLFVKVSCHAWVRINKYEKSADRMRQIYEYSVPFHVAICFVWSLSLSFSLSLFFFLSSVSTSLSSLVWLINHNYLHKAPPCITRLT